MADLNSTLVRGNLRVTDDADINGNVNASTFNGLPLSGSTGANTIPIRDSNGYAYFNYINTNVGTENPSSYSGVTLLFAGSDGWIRKASPSNVSVGYATSAGSATDSTKIPLAGSTAITGGLVPSLTDSIDLGGASKRWNNIYGKNIIVSTDTGKFELQGGNNANAAIKLDSQEGNLKFTLVDNGGNTSGTYTLSNTGANATIATQTWVSSNYATTSVATQSANGLMSATDKSNLDGIVASLNNDDSDSVVNRLKDVLSVFQDYPEGTTILSALNNKVNISNSTLSSGADLNTILTTGFYAIGGSYTNGPANNVLAFSQLLVGHSGNDTHFQMGFPYNSSRIFFRNGNNDGTWQAWREVITDGNIGSQSVNYANSAGSVAWSNVSGHPTDLGDFTNNAGYTKNAGTVTSVSAGTGLSISGTASTTPTVNIASGYKLPTTTEWNGTVKTSGNQEISGIKTFTDGIKIKSNGDEYGQITPSQNGIDIVVSDGVSNTTTYTLDNSEGGSKVIASRSWVQGQGYTSNIGTVTSITVGSTSYSPSSGVVALPAYPTIPTNVSSFTNDAGYITSSSLSGYATQTWVQNQGYSTFTGYSSSNKLSTSYIQNDAGWTSNAGTVTSVRVQAGTGLSSSTSTAQTSTLSTTISIASGYKLPTTTEWNGTVKTSGNQDISGIKTFADGIKFKANGDEYGQINTSSEGIDIVVSDGVSNTTTYTLDNSEGGTKTIATREWIQNGLPYTTTAPSAANSSGRLKIVVLSSEPSTKYNGYIYIITG